MPSMTKGQFRFLSDVKELDDIQLGCLAVRFSVGSKKLRRKLKKQCLARKWIYVEPRDDIWLETMYLSSRGLRSWRIAKKRLDPPILKFTHTGFTKESEEAMERGAV